MLLAALAIGIPLLIRSRRRADWLAELDTAEAEAIWFARALIPELKAAGSHERAAGAWGVSSARVVATEDALTGLEASAPDDESRIRATTLRDAVRSGRGQVEQLVRVGADATLGFGLEDVAVELERVLPPAPPPGSP
ncbi:hypothetical protein [Angustibacter luteus]|uniref:Uncharacterized protein n=1 Tax=Angustibacter luteus TaxID=658456 RepID=A0ABW1JEA0_9ACTN